MPDRRVKRVLSILVWGKFECLSHTYQVGFINKASIKAIFHPADSILDVVEKIRQDTCHGSGSPHAVVAPATPAATSRKTSSSRVTTLHVVLQVGARQAAWFSYPNVIQRKSVGTHVVRCSWYTCLARWHIRVLGGAYLLEYVSIVIVNRGRPLPQAVGHTQQSVTCSVGALVHTTSACFVLRSDNDEGYYHIKLDRIPNNAAEPPYHLCPQLSQSSSRDHAPPRPHQKVCRQTLHHDVLTMSKTSTRLSHEPHHIASPHRSMIPPQTQPSSPRSPSGHDNSIVNP